MEVCFVFDPGGALVFRGESFMETRFGKAATLQEDGGAVTRCANEAPKGLMDAPHSGEEVAFAKGTFTVGGGMRLAAGLPDAVDFGQGGTDHHGGVHAPAEGVDAFGIARTEDEKEGVFGKEGGLDEGFLFGEFEAARLDGGARLGFEGF
jgi:hypothetical protein